MGEAQRVGVAVGYVDWARAHEAGLAATPPRATARECGIRDCGRAAYKGELCRRHWDMVPYERKVALQIDALNAQRRVVEKHHRDFLRLVRVLDKPSRTKS